MAATAATINANLVEVNKWRGERGVAPASYAWVRDAYRKFDIAPKVLPAARAAPGALSLIPAPAAAADPGVVINNARQAFLDRQLKGLPNRRKNWKGIKFLWEGRIMRVGLWEWQPAAVADANLQKDFKKLVVKENYKGGQTDELQKEYDVLVALKATGSRHIVRSPYAPANYNQGGNPNWAKRIFLEYCENGDLVDLFELRRKRNHRFEVLTAWKMFECLVDGVCAMQYGKELDSDTASNNPYAYVLPAAGWLDIIHFDIKDSNVFVGGADLIHTNAPILKFGDFGMAEKITAAQNAAIGFKDTKEQWRNTKGTQGVFPPEQLHEDWEARNWWQSGIAGNFDGATFNLFGVGIVMYQILTLDSPPDLKNPFLPNYTLSGAPPLARTYGPDLDAYSGVYSKTLTDLVYECLYEDPVFRPALEVLKEKICRGYVEALNSGARPEGWEQFIPDPTLPAGARGPLKRDRKGNLTGQAYDAGTKEVRCEGMLLIGAQCKRTFRTMATDTTRPRCFFCTRDNRPLV